MKNDGLNNYKAIQVAFSHTLEEIYYCTEHYYRAIWSKTYGIPCRKNTIWDRVFSKGILKSLTILEMPPFLFISCV